MWLQVSCVEFYLLPSLLFFATQLIIFAHLNIYMGSRKVSFFSHCRSFAIIGIDLNHVEGRLLFKNKVWKICYYEDNSKNLFAERGWFWQGLGCANSPHLSYRCTKSSEKASDHRYHACCFGAPFCHALRTGALPWRRTNFWDFLCKADFLYFIRSSL